MAVTVGTAGFTSGTGVQGIDFGISNPIFIEADYGSSTYKPSRGFMYGGDQSTIPNQNAVAVDGKFLQIKNSSNVVVYELVYTGNTGTVANFNRTINSIGSVDLLFRVGNQ